MQTVATIVFVILVAAWVADWIKQAARDAVRRELENERRRGQSTVSPGLHWNRYSFNKGEKAPGPTFLD